MSIFFKFHRGRRPACGVQAKNIATSKVTWHAAMPPSLLEEGRLRRLKLIDLSFCCRRAVIVLVHAHFGHRGG